MPQTHHDGDGTIPTTITPAKKQPKITRVEPQASDMREEVEQAQQVGPATETKEMHNDG